MTLSMLEAKDLIISMYHANEPLMLLGSPGGGKTSLFKAVTEELKIGHLDWRLTMRDPVDVGGMRIPDLKSGRMKHYLPNDFPTEKIHGDRGMIVFDEINAVGPMMQATAYGLIQERRSGEEFMPDGWVPMATGNLTSDKAAAQRITSALANRFNVQTVVSDVPSWLAMYASEHVDPRGCAFMRFRPGLLHVMPAKDEVSFPSPRSWTKAFKFIDMPKALRFKTFVGYVGEAAASEFEAFMDIYDSAVRWDEILADPDNAKLPEKTAAGVYYAVAGMVSKMMDRKNMKQAMRYVSRMMPDYQVVIAQDATKRDPGLMNTPEYGAWAVKHADVVM